MFRNQKNSLVLALFALLITLGCVAARDTPTSTAESTQEAPVVSATMTAATTTNAAAPAVSLRAVQDFDSIDNETQRSRALFVEAGRVIQHPRCLNCHPTDAHPRQGDDLAMHQPPVVRGPENHGTVAMQCSTCHQAENIEHAGLPGHPKWHVAPVEMGWIGVSLADICEQIKDQERNGGMDLEALHHHMAEDTLVGWGWNPGPDRESAPGTQASFGELIRAWIDTGAHCPDGVAGAATGPPSLTGQDCASCHGRSAPSLGG